MGFAQPKAEAVQNADRAQSPATVDSTGVLVAQVQAGGPAEKAGIARGDIIIEVQGTAVNTPSDLARVMKDRKAGDALSVKLKHGDTMNTVTLTLGTRQDRPWVGILLAPSEFAFQPGMRGGDRGFGMGPGRGGPGFDGAPFPMGMRAAGAEITSVAAGSPAEKAGLKEGDLILSLDGTRIDPRHALSDMVAAKKAGDTVTLSIQSVGQEAPRDVKVTLAKNPDKDSTWMGIGYAWARQGRMPGPNTSSMMAGVLVAEVADNSPAAKAGMRTRDIITKVEGLAVVDPQMVVDALAKHKAGDALLITVYRMADDKETDITVTLGKNPGDPAKAYLGVTMSSFAGFEGMPHRGPGASGTDGGRGADGTQEFPTL